MEIKVMSNILEQNDQTAARVNANLTDQGIFCFNLLGSPGSGKTSLLEETIGRLQGRLRLAVIEGDLYTAKDAQRIACHQVPVVQINTAGGCHLDAAMVEKALQELDLTALDVIVVENVGNLVCPAEFRVGEDLKVVVLSITEGEDKPMKYPLVFQQSAAVVLNKTDLLPYTNFDQEAACRDIRSLQPEIALFAASCRTGEGLEAWCHWLEEQVAAKQQQAKRQ